MRIIKRIAIIPVDGHFDVLIEDQSGHSLVRGCCFGEMLEQVAFLVIDKDKVENRRCYREEVFDVKMFGVTEIKPVQDGLEMEME